MFSQIKVNRKSKQSICHQLSHAIIEVIENKKVQPGEKLPPERDFSQSVGVSRGTVKKVYDTLAQKGYLVITQGSGSYVADRFHTAKDGNMVGKFQQTIEHFLQEDYDTSELRSTFEMVTKTHLKGKKLVKIAAVDCNLEALDIFEIQLGYLKEIYLHKILFTELHGFKSPVEALDAYDIIFTTLTHFDELVAFVPSLKHKIVQAVVSPNRNTLVGIFGMPDPQNCAIITRTNRFANIINSHLASFHLEVPRENWILQDALTLEYFLTLSQQKKVVIMPPFYALRLSAEVYRAILSFHRNGGEIICFHYTIEQGSLIHIEEKILKSLQNKE